MKKTDRSKISEKISITFSLILSLFCFLMIFSCTSKPNLPEQTPDNPEPEQQRTENETELQTETSIEEENPFKSFIEVELPATESFLLDDFEEGLYFYAVGDSWDSWGGHNLGYKCLLSSEWNTDGDYSIKCIQEKASDPEKSSMATWYCDSPLETDWSDYKTLAVDIYNGGPVSANICLQLQCTEAWNWCQTACYPLDSGTQTTFLFDIEVFGSDNLQDIKRFMFSNMGSEYTYMYFDNIRLYK